MNYRLNNIFYLSLYIRTNYINIPFYLEMILYYWMVLCLSGSILFYLIIILSGFRLIASSLPLISLVGVGVGVGIIFGSLLNSLGRNFGVSNSLIRWAFIGFSLVEVSGFIGIVFCFMFLYALIIYFLRPEYILCLYIRMFYIIRFYLVI